MTGPALKWQKTGNSANITYWKADSGGWWAEVLTDSLRKVGGSWRAGTPTHYLTLWRVGHGPVRKIHFRGGALTERRIQTWARKAGAR